jgi:tetratricopeptide (TPR) repeat protein
MKILALFLLVLAANAFSQVRPDCASEVIRDSLLKAYSERAHQFSIDHPGWGQTFDTLISICPNISGAYQGRALHFMATRNFEKLFENIDKAVTLDTIRWLPYRGYLHCILAKNYEKAIADFDEAEKRMPNAFTMDHSFSFYKAIASMEMGKFDQAENYFLKDIQTQKRGQGQNDIHYNSLLYFGIMYYLSNELDKAQARLSECLQLYEQHPTANYYMGLIMKATGNKQQAAYFQKAKQFMEEGYLINEPNSQLAPYPRQVTVADLEKM